jgi:hypothetical protein
MLIVDAAALPLGAVVEDLALGYVDVGDVEEALEDGAARPGGVARERAAGDRQRIVVVIARKNALSITAALHEV